MDQICFMFFSCYIDSKKSFPNYRAAMIKPMVVSKPCDQTNLASVKHPFLRLRRCTVMVCRTNKRESFEAMDRFKSPKVLVILVNSADAWMEDWYLPCSDCCSKAPGFDCKIEQTNQSQRGSSNTLAAHLGSLFAAKLPPSFVLRTKPSSQKTQIKTMAAFLWKTYLLNLNIQWSGV